MGLIGRDGGMRTGGMRYWRRYGGVAAVRCSPVRSNTFSISQFRVPPAGGGGDGDGGAALLLLLYLTVAQPYPITLSPPPTHPPSKCCGY